MANKYSTIALALIILIFFSILGFIVYNYFSNFSKNFVNDRGTIEVYYLNKNIKELVNAIDKLDSGNPGLFVETDIDSIFYFKFFLFTNGAKKKISFRISGGEEYMKMYQNLANEPSTLKIEPNQTIIDFFAPELTDEEKMEIKPLIKQEFIDKLELIHSSSEPPFNYELFYESPNSSWIIALKKY